MTTKCQSSENFLNQQVIPLLQNDDANNLGLVKQETLDFAKKNYVAPFEKSNIAFQSLSKVRSSGYVVLPEGFNKISK